MATYSLHVLSVDCNIQDAKILELIIKSQHHYVDRVTSSEDALKCMYKKKYNLLFYSSNPKDTNTIDFIKTVRQLDSDISIIPIYPKVKESESEQEAKDTEAQARDAGALDVIRKPYTVDIIKHCLVLLWTLLGF
ncbi:hypothetical protein AGMMS49593_08400 [Endomicrobiia bacterium]|nr:hypothetical protein AGMMS49593_08400 [Endomicrobiia bacterium]